MLTRFAIDPDALLSARGSEHTRFIKQWQQYGILIHDADEFSESELYSTVNNLPQAFRIIWKKIVDRNKSGAWIKPGPKEWKGLRGIEDNIEQLDPLHQAVGLVCLEETRMELVKKVANKNHPDIELSDFSEIDTSAAFELSQALAQKPIRSTGASALWRERFEAIASVAKNITIVDRYALSYRDTEKSGLETFLVYLDGTARRANVTIYSSYGNKPDDVCRADACARCRSISERLARGGVCSLKLHLAPSGKFGRVAHDRFVRFDHLVIELGVGLAVFEGKGGTFSSKPQSEEHQNLISELLRICPSKPDVDL